jgi:2-polyprenyl-6-methoxyphenol hydroxylase-like FAD-dependent oxidoreductase
MGATATEVLIVGAGPTGLMFAMWLRRLGVAFRIIDQTEGPGTTSRAIVVQARSLEHFQQLGIAQELVDGGVKVEGANLWIRGEQVAHVPLGELGTGISRFPYALIFPQDQQEQLLVRHLAAEQVFVERSTRLLGFTVARTGRVTAELEGPAGKSECDARWIAGCDGARSTVRQQLGVGFPGGTYDRQFYVADVEVEGPLRRDELHIAIDDADFLVVFPLKGERAARLVGAMRVPADENHQAQFSDVSSQAAQRLGLTFSRVNWFSTYRVHHRVAEKFHSGPAFLVGDAAHIHSPVGGQGMNTGVCDAVNLAWKLAAVAHGEARPELLETYEPERIAFARRLVATTDRGFTLVTREGAIARGVRSSVVPRVVPMLIGRSSLRRLMFKTVSQTNVSYRHSALSRGRAGAVRAGDRLPWIAGFDNFRPLASLEWQVHVYGVASKELEDACRARRLALHTTPWSEALRGHGFQENAVYLIRPDGHVGFAGHDREGLERYVEDFGLRFREREPGAPRLDVWR